MIFVSGFPLPIDSHPLTSTFQVLFYGTLNAFRGVKNKNGNGSAFSKANKLYKDALRAMKAAAELSSFNYKNKVHLLEAEHNSFKGHFEAAKASYAAAISCSRSSQLKHEEALAYELCGLHNMNKTKDKRAAQEMFLKAKECYTSWGCAIKVNSINRQLERLSNS